MCMSFILCVFSSVISNGTAHGVECAYSANVRSGFDRTFPPSEVYRSGIGGLALIEF